MILLLIVFFVKEIDFKYKKPKKLIIQNNTLHEIF